MFTNNSYKLGAISFIIGLALLFSQRFISGVFFSPVFGGTTASYLDFYVWSSVVATVMIILGVILFFKGRKESSANASSEPSFRHDKNIE